MPARSSLDDSLQPGEQEAPDDSQKASCLTTPLFGWGRAESCDFHYLVPFYYHRFDPGSHLDPKLLDVFSEHHAGMADIWDSLSG